MLRLTMPGNIFSPNGIWTQRVDTAPVAGASEAMVANLVAQVRGRGNGEAFVNIYQYGMSWVNVGPRQERSRVLFHNCQAKPSTPRGLYGAGGQFENVPIPDDATPTPGTDSSLSIYQASTDTLWDFWKAYRDDKGWHACWGGRIDNVSANPGIFAENYGASASGLAFEGGAIAIRDVVRGRIDHALALSIPEPAHSARVSWPAQRSDGVSTDPSAIPEGTRLRLDPSLDLHSLPLTRFGRLVAEAAQTYGFILADRASVVTLRAENPERVLVAGFEDPWEGVLEGRQPFKALVGFPWEELQALPQDWGENRLAASPSVESTP